jgi:lysozyme
MTDPRPAAPPAAARPKAPAQGPALVTLIALVGSGLAGALIGDIRGDEGRAYHAYRDLGGIVTGCDGDTFDVQAGQDFTDAECDERTARRLVEHAGIVIRCVPALREVGREQQLRAATRFNYNLGAFCAGSPGRLMKVGRWRDGCLAMLAYKGLVGPRPIAGAEKVTRLKDGRYFNQIKGLRLRREREVAGCLSTLPPAPAPVPVGQADFPLCVASPALQSRWRSA